MQKSENVFLKMKEKLYSAVISDSLDDLGFRNQVMREDITSLKEGDIIVGRAKTILAVDVDYIPDDPYGKEIEAIDSIVPDEVVVASTNQSKQNGMWGELLSTASKVRGANGAVIDGFVRDTQKILDLDFPVYATGRKPVDSKGRGIVLNYDCLVNCGGVIVQPGDFVFADIDGVVVIPNQLFDQVVELSLDKVKRENSTRDELLAGGYLKDIYDKYGVL
ncbi:RraA family protein [Alteribacillus sp. HJP-4]|uniref:RraA family protein n=1 Tax=Alteribacillus sp. HJP-4 TaxID=2775394 RepID=UPI0035CCD74D